MDPARRISYIGRMSVPDPGGKVTLKQLGGLGALLRRPGLTLMTLRAGRAIGSDALGNHYFERRHPKSKRNRRWVIFAGPAEASAIGPEWHSWLNYLTDAPLPDTGRKPWQKPHQKNLTGSPAGYRPAGHDYEGGNRAAASADYESWSPDL